MKNREIDPTLLTFTGFPSCVTAYGSISVIPRDPASPVDPNGSSAATTQRRLPVLERSTLGNPQRYPPERTWVAPIARLSATAGGTVFTIA